MKPRALWVKRLLGVVAVAAPCAVFAASVHASPTTTAASPPAPVASAPGKAAPAASGVLRATLEQWRIIDSQSGPVNYYAVLHEGPLSFVRGSYQPPNKKAVLGFEVPEGRRGRLRRLDWSWRAIKFPAQGDECVAKKGDSTAVLYVTWRRFLRWYSLKYVWSTTRKPGTVCDRRRNTFIAQDTIVLESGGPPGVWKHESIDLAREFRAHFGEGDEHADVPPLMGLGVMTDGDQTRSESSGDFADFVFSQ